MNKSINPNGIAVTMSVVILGILIYFSLISDGAWGGADNYIHYKLARYSYEHPEFFLDHWGKPLFTLLSSPFAQFGFEGIKIFNILLGVCSGFLCFKIAEKLNYSNAVWALPITVFTPIFFMMLFSSMTEVLFAFVIVSSMYLFLRSKFIAAAIVISFLPFARTEGIVVIPCVFLALLYVKKYKAIPFLLTGIVLYTLVGGLYYDDFLWLITKMPYGDASGIYGHGGPFDFIIAYEEITGIIISILLLIGTIQLLFHLVRKKDNKRETILEFLLLFLPLLGYLSFHSFLWWKGMGGSLGLTRVMAGVMPLAALLALRGWNALLTPKVLSLTWVKITATSVLVFFIIKTTVHLYSLPILLDGPNKVVKDAADWLKESEYYTKKMYYYDPFFYPMLDINPYDNSRLQELVPDRDHPEVGIAIGDLVLWDAHLSPNEGGLPLKRMQENEHFKTLQVFKPEYPFKVLGGYDYEVHIFQKIK